LACDSNWFFAPYPPALVAARRSLYYRQRFTIKTGYRGKVNLMVLNKPFQPGFSPAGALAASGALADAERHRAAGDTEQARRVLEQAIKEAPAPALYCALGALLHESGADEDAVSALGEAIAADPAHHPAYAALADIANKNGFIREAIEYAGQALQLEPENSAYRQHFLDLLAYNAKQTKFNPLLKQTISDSLAAGTLEYGALGRCWYALLRSDPLHKPHLKATMQRDHGGFCKVLRRGDYRAALRDPYFIDGVRHLVVSNRDFEKYLTGLRRLLLGELTDDSGFLPEEDFTALAAALAHYCFATEYVFALSPDEQAQQETLRKKISTGEATLPEIAVLGCYIPLYQLDNAAALQKTLMAGGADLQALAALQIDQPLAQQELRPAIAPLDTITDATSQAVQAQYEDFPYPRWRKISSRAELFAEEKTLSGKNAAILIAGCGTGQEALTLAHLLPDAEVTALDLSRNSLAYAAQKAQQFNIRNVRFLHGDLLNVGALGSSFDFVASSGVLHHMADPMQGWRAITDVLKPGGLMRIALYSEIARRHIAEMQQIIKDKNYASDAAAIRALRGDIDQLANKHAIDNITGFHDYYYLSECRDLLFHVQEHRFTLPQIKQSLDTLGLEFIRFYIGLSNLRDYQKQNPNDKAATDLESWARYEARHQDLFAGMYRFLCRKPG